VSRDKFARRLAKAALTVARADDARVYLSVPGGIQAVAGLCREPGPGLAGNYAESLAVTTYQKNRLVVVRRDMQDLWQKALRCECVAAEDVGALAGLPLHGTPAPLGVLVVAWRLYSPSAGREELELLEQLCRHGADALARLRQ
jgi:hypothetical protein